jgi:3-methyladenine DNA glycosylase AlkC
MSEPFKNLINPASIREIGDAISRAYPAFPLAAFCAEAATGLDAMELKARVVHVAAALRRGLPAAWPAAVDALLGALPAPLPSEEGVSSTFIWWPLLQVVEDHAADPEVSLPALREMTRRFSAEFAIRPYIDRFPDAAWAALDAWASDADVHVRRLASEGSRPRLPWGRRISASIADPRRGIALISRLVDDPSEYVRRSVANHLGDVAKDHPDLAVDSARAWLVEPSRAPAVKHALRHLLKQGHPGALALLGQGDAGVSLVAFTRHPERVRVGEPVALRGTVRANANANARVDLIWEWPGARGWSRRIFRVGDRALSAGESWEFRYNLSTKPVSTRPTRLGGHRVALRVNGVDHPPVGFELVEGG